MVTKLLFKKSDVSPIDPQPEVPSSKPPFCIISFDAVAQKIVVRSRENVLVIMVIRSVKINCLCLLFVGFIFPRKIIHDMDTMDSLSQILNVHRIKKSNPVTSQVQKYPVSHVKIQQGPRVLNKCLSIWKADTFYNN